MPQRARRGAAARENTRRFVSWIQGEVLPRPFRRSRRRRVGTPSPSPPCPPRGLLLREPVRGGVLAHVLRDLHRAEVRAAHRAEVGELGPLGRQGLVVELAGGLGIEREVELVLPAELEARLRQRVVPGPRSRMALGEVGGVGRDLVGDDAVLDVLLVRAGRGAPWGSRSRASRCPNQPIIAAPIAEVMWS